MSNKLSKEEVLRRIKDANIDMILLEEYSGKSVRDYHKFRCNKCGNDWYRRLDHVFEGRGCPKCKFSLKHDEKTINEISGKYDIELYGDYTKAGTVTSWKCKKCGGLFSSCFSTIRDGRKFCPYCSPKFYKNEKLTGKYITDILPNVEVIKNFKINEKIENIRNFVLVDYYLETCGKKIIIEFNGTQHYTPCKFWDKNISEAAKKYEEQKIRDMWLKNYCQQKDIHLIVIDGRRIYNSKIKSYLEKELSVILPNNSMDTPAKL